MKFLPYALVLILAVVIIALLFTGENKLEYEVTSPKDEQEEEVVEEETAITDEESEDQKDVEDKAPDIKEEEPERYEEKEEELSEDESLKNLVYEFLGRPYERGPLGEEEGERIYREDVFDCTTLVLVSASKYNANGKSAEEMMKVANYYPAEVISYENRLHFTTYRNKVSPLFEDITRQIGGDLTEQKKVLLNKDKEGEGRLIDIDWEEEVVIKYIKTEDIQKITENIPKKVGVAFIVDGDENMGLDVRHEGFVFNSNELVHASSQRGEVYKEDLLKFLENSNYTGVLFFKFPK